MRGDCGVLRGECGVTAGYYDGAAKTWGSMEQAAVPCRAGSNGENLLLITLRFLGLTMVESSSAVMRIFDAALWIDRIASST